jgi:AcrR family transcriptional regulator
MLGQRFTEIVEDCLQRLDQGEDLMDILADYPEYLERLKPLLLVAMASRALPVPIPNQTAKRMGKLNLLAEMAQVEEQAGFSKTLQIPATARFFGGLVSSIRSTGLTAPAPKFRLLLVALIFVFGAGFYTLNVSAGGYSAEFVNYLSSGFQKVIQALSFEEVGPSGLQFGQFQFFSGTGLNFNNQIAKKGFLVLDNEDEVVPDLTSEDKGEGPKNQNQNRYGNDPETMPPAAAGEGHQEIDNSGLALGHDKDQENNGLALGHDKDQENNGLALGHDKDQDNNGLALGKDKILQKKVKE